jgi:hypothetical protein
MIKLSGSSITTWESQPFSHPVLTGMSYVNYQFTHNKGRTPDIIVVYKHQWGIWTPSKDSDFYNSTGYGWEPDPTSADDNTSSLNLYRYTDSPTNLMKVKFYWFN